MGSTCLCTGIYKFSGCQRSNGKSTRITAASFTISSKSWNDICTMQPHATPELIDCTTTEKLILLHNCTNSNRGKLRIVPFFIPLHKPVVYETTTEEMCGACSQNLLYEQFRNIICKHTTTTPTIAATSIIKLTTARVEMLSICNTNLVNLACRVLSAQAI